MRPCRMAMSFLGSLAPVTALVLTGAAGIGQAAPAASTWRAVQLQPPAGAQANPFASPTSVACASAADCVTAGSYFTSRGQRAMVATRTNGKWAKATTLTLPANAGADPEASAGGIACPAAGSCVAVGSYLDRVGITQLFADAELRGKWQRAVEVRKPATTAKNGIAVLTSVSCTGAGNCVAVGAFRSKAGQQFLAVRDAGGRWQQALGVRTPSTAAGPDAGLTSVSCWKAGHCRAAGTFEDSAGHTRPLVVTDDAGTWSQPVKVAAPAGAAANPNAEFLSISCDKAGLCGLAGSYLDKNGIGRAMVDTQGKQGWPRASEVPPPAGARQAPAYGFHAISCTAAGSCVAVGSIDTGSAIVPLIATRSGGRWKGAVTIKPPPKSKTQGGNSSLDGVSCPGGSCIGVGSDLDTSNHTVAFAATKN